MNQRGSIGIYLVFSIVVSIAAGFGVYRWIRDHKSSTEDDATTTTAAPKTTKAAATPTPVQDPIPEAPPVEEATPEETPEETPAMIAASRATNPIGDPDVDGSPVFGLPGIAGGIERGSVDRRFRSRAEVLQRCYERNGSEGGGNLTVTMEIDSTGKITRIALSAGWDEGFEACVISALNFTFSAPKDGKAATVVQQIAFR